LTLLKDAVADIFKPPEEKGQGMKERSQFLIDAEAPNRHYPPGRCLLIVDPESERPRIALTRPSDYASLLLSSQMVSHHLLSGYARGVLGNIPDGFSLLPFYNAS